MDSLATAKLVEERILEVLASFGAEPDVTNREATFEQLDIDSLDLVELAQIVDEEYGVELTIEDAEILHNVGDAIDLIVSRMSSPAALTAEADAG
jgi:acyl carrier protein